jgi:transcriptional regulator with XRE-family HTH domain
MKRKKGHHRNTAADVIFGHRLRQIRLQRGMTQVQLGEALGFSYQQVQKYESGVNAIASSHIKRLCETLRITPDQLYEIDPETQELAKLSPYTIHMAQKINQLSANQRRAVTMLLKSFGVEDE